MRFAIETNLVFVRDQAAKMPMALFLFGGSLLSMAWIVPPLAVLVAWPFLTVVPGWVLVARVAPSISPPGRLGIGIVASVFASAFLVDVLSLLFGGFRSWVTLAAAWLMLGGTLVLAGFRAPWLTGPPLPLAGMAGRAVETFRRDRAIWLLAAVSGAVVGAILWIGAWHDTERGWIAGGWNWSDLLVHVSIGQSLIDGNFPPQVPYFAGVPLAYHWFGDFHAAILAGSGGVGLIDVFFVSNGVLAAALTLLVWELAFRLTGDRRAAVIAAVIALFGGGLGWIRLPMDLLAGRGDLLHLLTTTPYDNTWAGDWPLFRIGSVLGTGFGPHRATAYGLPGLVAVALLAQASFGRSRAGVLSAGVLAALLAPFHFYFFPAAYVVAGLCWLTAKGWRAPRWALDPALFLAPSFLALPFVVPALSQQSAHGAVHLVIGWSEAPLPEGPPAVAFFYLTNLGLPFILALVAAVRPGLPHRAWLVTWAVSLFLVPNLVVVGTVVFDMNKYFQAVWIALAIMAAWLIRRWPRPLIATVLVVSSLSPALVGFWSMTSDSVALSNPQEAAATWISSHTPERSVFVTDAYINSPVDLAGRLRVTTFGPYAANLGYDPDRRAADVHAVYCDGPERAASIMGVYGATYVLSSGGLLQCDGHEPTDFGSSPLFETVYSKDGVTIWHLP
jgi:hypothetical protein